MLIRIVLLMAGLWAGSALACDNFISLRDANWLAQRGDDPAWVRADLDDSHWHPLPLIQPEPEEGLGPQDGFLWYRLHFTVAADALRHPCYLMLGRIHEADEVYLNGARIGGEGRMGPRWFDYVSAMRKTRAYAVPPGLLRSDGDNVLAVRMFSMFLGAGVVSGVVGLGPPDFIVRKALTEDGHVLHIEIATLTLLLLMVMMTAFIVLARPSERRHLLVFGMVLVVTVNYVVDISLLYPLRLEAPWLKRLIFIAMPNLPLLVVAYVARVSAEPLSRWIWALALLPLPMAVLYQFNLPTPLAITLYDFWHLSFLPIAVVLPVYMARKARPAIHNPRLVRAAVVVLVIAVVYGLLGSGFLPGDLDPMELGILGMMLLFMLAFARRLAQEYEARLRLSAGVLATQDEERRRIARELHDGLGQRLVAVRLHLEAQALERPDGQLNDVVRELRDTTRELRAIVHGLRPVELGEVSLRSALHSYGTRVLELTGVRIHVHFGQIGYMTNEIEEHLFRIFQEAIHNAVRHGQAQNVSVELRAEGDDLLVQIGDDGGGFDIQADQSQGLGLTAMAERVRLCQGRFHLHSSPGKGTTIRIRIPLS